MNRKAPQKPAKVTRGRKSRPAPATSGRAAKPVPKKTRRPAPAPKRKAASSGKRSAKTSVGARLKVRAPSSRAAGHRGSTAVRTLPSPGIEGRAKSGLTAAETEEFRHMLLEKRAEILGDVSTLHNEALNKDRREAAGDLSSMPIHMADLGSDNYELEFTLGLIEGERAILKEIDEALERIREGAYGRCLATGKPIGKTRLRAKPWAKYCYEYTLAQEQGQARRL